MKHVYKEIEWFASFDAIFHGCARYDTGLSECSLEADDVHVLLDDDMEQERLDRPLGVDDVQRTMDQDTMQPNNICNPVEIVPIASTNEPTEAGKTSMRPAVSVSVEKEVASVKLSAKTLAFAQANQDLKTSSLKHKHQH